MQNVPPTADITAVANIRMREVTALHAAVADGNISVAQALQTEVRALSARLESEAAVLAAAVKSELVNDGVLTDASCLPPLG